MTKRAEKGAEGRQDLAAIAKMMKESRRKLGLSREKMAEALGIGVSTLASYESGNAEPKAGVLVRLRRLGVPADWILALGEASLPSGDFENLDRQPPVPVKKYDVEVSAGDGAFVQDEHVQTVLFPRTWLEEHIAGPLSELALVKARDDSMEPEISHGDDLFVDMTVTKIIGDGIYVIRINDELKVKRLQRFLDGRVAIKSTNPAYDDYIIEKNELSDLHIIGRVRWHGRAL